MSNYYQKLVPVDLGQISMTDFDLQSLPGGIRGIDIGIRPCRQDGPCIMAQKSKHQLIINNYGHGGGGWSLSHGSVLYSLELLERHHPDRDAHITIIGAGVMGLLSAIYLTEYGYNNIMIVARDFKGITSYRSTGYFAPLAMNLHNKAQQDFINKIGFKTFSTFRDIEQGQHPVFKQGIKPIDVYTGTGEGTGAIETESGLEPYTNSGILPEPDTVQIDFGNGQRHLMRRSQTYFMNTPGIMQELNQLVTDRGINKVQKTINDFSELHSDIVFNCSGIGARELNHDSAVHPNLGLLLLLEQPNPKALDYIIYTRFKSSPDSEANYIYFMPRDNGLLGATFIPFNDGSDTAQVQRLVQHIIRDNKAFFGT